MHGVHGRRDLKSTFTTDGAAASSDFSFCFTAQFSVEQNLWIFRDASASDRILRAPLRSFLITLEHRNGTTLTSANNSSVTSNTRNQGGRKP